MSVCRLRRVGAAAIACVCLPALVGAQEAPRGAVSPLSDATGRAIVEELRQLRALLERSLALSSRSQLLVSRVTLQQQRVDRLSAELRNTEERLTGLASENQSLSSMIGGFQERVEHESDVKEQRLMEEQLTQLRAHLERNNGERERLAAQKAAIEQELGAETGLLQDLHRRLDEIERALEPPR